MGQTPSGDELGSGYNVELANSEACRWTSELHCYGQGEDYNWGFRIYRTTYTTESDRDFATGLRILSSHLRKACFRDSGDDDTPNKQIWERMKNTVIEDRAQFDGAPPSVIQRHFQNWIEEQGYHLPNLEPTNPSQEMASSSSHRFCIIIDAEALRNLLRFSPSAIPQVHYEDRIGVKVLDVECHADSEDYEPPFDEGWLWSAPWNLPEIWFEYKELSAQEFRDTDGLERPVALHY